MLTVEAGRKGPAPGPPAHQRGTLVLAISFLFESSDCCKRELVLAGVDFGSDCSLNSEILNKELKIRVPKYTFTAVGRHFSKANIWSTVFSKCHKADLS